MQPATYIGGMYPLAGQPLYPALWHGCVGAWAPCLGPTGLTLRDWSGFANHGVLTNMDASTDWILGGGRNALYFDNSTNYVSCGLNPGLQLTSRGTLSAWIRKRSTNTNCGIIGNIFNNNFTGGFGLLYRSGVPTAVVSNAFTFSFISAASDTLSNAVWYHLAFTFTGSTLTIYLDGKVLVTGSQATTASGGGTSILIGNSWASTPSIIYPWIGDLDCLMMHNRALTQGEVQMLASRRGIAYELAPRRRSRIFTGGGFKAYWAARKALIQLAGTN